VLGFYLIVAFKLPETHKPTKEHRLKIKNLLSNYAKALLNKNYLLSIFCLIFTWSIIIAFSIIGPFLLQNIFKFSASEYGLLALFVGLGFIIGSLINSKLIKKFPASFLIKTGIIISFFSALVFVLLSVIGDICAWQIMLSTFIVVLGAGITSPNYIAIAVAEHPDIAGTAIALLSALLFIGTTLVTVLLTIFHAHSATTLAGIFIVLTILCAIVFPFIRTKEYVK